MAYVNLTKDFSEVKRTISGLGLTKRQLVAFASGAAVGIPVFLLLKPHFDITICTIVMAMLVLPICFVILYKKDGAYIKKRIKY